ncbi:MAG: NAD(P)H-binding protein [Actinomycetota bacterium]|nr:NAD(P)H-binding protein [Actinomycetota bacterium]
MRVVVAGGHGQIAMLLQRLLAERGDEPVGIVRNPDHVGDLEAVGAKAVVLDLEQAGVQDVAGVVEGADALVFAAGAGPGSGAARKHTVDRDAAVLLADAALAAGVRRYVMVSAIKVDEADPESDDVFQVYLRAKSAADAYVREQDLDWTIVRPGRLTDEAGTGQVRLGPDIGYGEVPRADVAAVLLGVLDDPATAGKQFNLVGGGTPIATALTDV